MSNAIRYTVLGAIAALATGAGCSGSVPPLPAGADVTCSSTDDCPSGTTCVTALGRCVSSDSADRQAPGVAAGTASVVPAIARAGTTVTVTFQATEELAALPVVRFVGATSALGIARRDGGVYTVQFPATTDAGAGTHSIVATLVDLFGNEAAAAPVGDVTLDFTAPTATAPVVTPAFARQGATLTAVVTLSEPAGASPSLTLDPAPALTATQGPGANQWTFTRVLDGSEPAGAVDLLLAARDAAGNELQQRFTGAAHIDFTPPQVAAADVATPMVREGDTLVAQVRFDEPLGAAPDVRLVPPAGAAAAVTASAIDSLTWALSYQVPVGAADGEHTLRVEASADRAGNPGDPAFLGTVRFDSTAPSVIGLATPGHPNHLYRAGEAVAVTFSTDEDLAGPPVVRLETVPLERNLTCVAGGGRSWTCTSALLDGTERPENIVNVSVRVADAAGNVTVAPTSVVLDFTAPTVLSATPGRPAFPAGGTITYVVSVSEPLAAAPALAATRDGAPAPGFFGAPSASSATTFTWSRPVPAGLDGSYAVTVTMQDEAGNPGAPTAGAGFGVDTAAPGVSGAITVLPAKAAFRAGDRPSVSFTVSESIPTPAARLSTATPIDATCTGGPTFTCTLSRALAATDLPEGATAMLVTLTDAAGNVGYGSKALVLDYTPPSLAGTPATQLLPGAGNLRSTITALGTGSTFRISLIAAEPLAAAPPVVAWDPGLTTSIALTLLSQSGTSYVYQLSTGAGVYPPATWRVRWDPVDLAGNRWPSPQTVATVAVDSQPPAAPATGAAASPLLLWRRVPWGTSTTSASSFVLSGLAGSTSGADLAVAWDGAAGREVGRAAISGGTFDMVLSSDPNDLWVSALDAAGNESAPIRVVDVMWAAGLAGKVAGSTFENPHRLETRTASLGAIDQQDAVDVGAASLGVSGDGLVVQTGGASFYRPVAGAVSPPPRRNYSLAYDAGRARTVLFGGQTVGGGRPGDTWEWDGNAWEPMSPADPEGDGNPDTWEGMPAFYDPVNGGVVLVTSSSWLWNGTSWRLLASPPPGSRTGSAAAWDDSRGVAVFFGGTPITDAPTYEWDGDAWTDVTPLSTTDSPSPRYWHQMAYDRVRGKVLVFGGMDYSTAYNDVWEWDGAARRWSQLAVAGTPPSPRTAFAMAWDAAAAGSGELVVHGGSVSGNADGRTYVMRQVGPTPTWLDVTPATSTVGMSHSAVYDAGNRKVLMLGAWWNGGAVQDGKLRAWSGSGAPVRAWSLLAPGDPEGDGNPAHTLVNDAAAVWHPARGVVVYHDGRTRDTWEWNHASWVHAASSTSVPAPPSARSDAGLGYHGASAILFGGGPTSSPLGDTWSWNGASWSLVDPSPVRTTTLNPLFRQNAGLVTNPSNGRLYRFGGSDYQPSLGVRYYSDVWEWNSPLPNRWTKIGGGESGAAGWSDPQGDGSPGEVPPPAVTWPSEVGAPRGFVVWDPGRGDPGIGRMVFYARSPVRVWEWIPPGSSVNPNSWIRHDLTLSGTHWPSSERALFYDTTLGAPVVVSGALLYGQAWVIDLDANVLREIPLANPFGLAKPDDWVGVFDGDVGRAVVVASQPYAWESGSAVRPAHVLHVDFSRANGPDPGACVNRASCPIQQIQVQWSGGGTAPGGTGARLQAWTGSWTTLAPVPGTAASPAGATWSWTSSSPFPASSLFHGRSRELTFQLVPSSPSTSDGTASVGSDAASVTVWYRRP